jgi:hypothetical protein
MAWIENEWHQNNPVYWIGEKKSIYLIVTHLKITTSGKHCIIYLLLMFFLLWWILINWLIRSNFLNAWENTKTNSSIYPHRQSYENGNPRGWHKRAFLGQPRNMSQPAYIQISTTMNSNRKRYLFNYGEKSVEIINELDLMWSLQIDIPQLESFLDKEWFVFSHEPNRILVIPF